MSHFFTFVAFMLGSNVLIALVVVSAIFRVFEEAIGAGADKIRSVIFIIARSAIAVSISTFDVLREIAPFVGNIVQIVQLTKHVGQASVVAFPVH